MEVWKSIKGYEDLYEISSIGRIRSKDKWVINSNVGGMRLSKSRLLNPPIVKGYVQVMLMNNNVKHQEKAHRLVATHFIPNPDNLPFVNHINGIKNDNRVENLEWVTKGDNARHAYRTGLKTIPRGENHPQVKLTAIQALEIYKAQGKHIDIAKVYGVSRMLVTSIKNGRSWSHTTGHIK